MLWSGPTTVFIANGIRALNVSELRKEFLVGVFCNRQSELVLADLFFYSEEVDFIKELLLKMKTSYPDHIHPIELEIKDTTYTARSASYLDLHLEMNSEDRLRIKKLYDKRDLSNFHIVNFPFICNNIPAEPVYTCILYIPQLIRYSRAVGSIMNSLIEGCCCLRRQYWTKGS